MPHAPADDDAPYASMIWWMLTGGLLPAGAYVVICCSTWLESTSAETATEACPGPSAAASRVSILDLVCCSTRPLAWAAVLSTEAVEPARVWPWLSVTTTLSVLRPCTDLDTVLTIASTRLLDGVWLPVMPSTTAALAGVSWEERAPVWARTMDTLAVATPLMLWMVLVSSPSRARW